MGKQKGLYFVGRVANVSYYTWLGIPCIRTIAGEVQQCPIIKDNYRLNGASTRMAGNFRKMLAAALPFPRSFDMQTRFRGALRNWLKYSSQPSQPPEKLLYLHGFSFNQAARLEPIFKAPLTLSQPQPHELLLQIPAFVPVKAITAPTDVTKIQLTIIAAVCDIATTTPLGKTEMILPIPYDNSIQPAHEILLPLQMPAGSLALVVVSLQFFAGDVNVGDERWLASEVVGGVAT